MAPLVVGRWSLVVGRWSLVVGRWSWVVGRYVLIYAFIAYSKLDFTAYSVKVALFKLFRIMNVEKSAKINYVVGFCVRTINHGKLVRVFYIKNNCSGSLENLQTVNSPPRRASYRTRSCYLFATCTLATRYKLNNPRKL